MNFKDTVLLPISRKLNTLRKDKEVSIQEGKVAIFGDIHSNLEALTEVVRDAKEQGVGKFVCTGDIVGYAANPEECLAIIKDLNCPCVMGNHDQYIGTDCSVNDFNLYALNAVLWSRKQLSEEERGWLKSLPMLLKQSSDVLSDYLGFNDFGVVHSTMVEPEQWNYAVKKDDCRQAIEEQQEEIVFFGHTHVPTLVGYNPESGEFGYQAPAKETVELRAGWKWLINPGSVGQPRDRNFRSSYAIYDSRKREVEFRRVVYDVAKASKKIEKVKLPIKNGARLFKGK